jgi:RNA polymerase sigma-70 factor (ECF subfamily)
MTDEQLLIGIRDKDPGAFDTIFERWYKKLCFFANRIISDQAASKDVVTESLLKLWGRKKAFSSVDHLESFMRVLVKNSCIDYLRKNVYRARIEREVLKSEAFTENAIEKKYFQAEIIEALYLQINKLPERTQQVFKLTYLEGHSRAEVAQILNLSENTVRNLNQIAMHTLKKAFGVEQKVIIYMLIYFICENS